VTISLLHNDSQWKARLHSQAREPFAVATLVLELNINMIMLFKP